MGLGNILLLSQVTFYVLSLIISFFIFIPLTVNHNSFNGHCLLHATGTWEESNVTGSKLDVTWGDSGQCNFGIFVGVILFPLSLFYVLWMSVYLFKGTEPSWASAFMALVISVVVAVMLFVAAVVITSGYDVWCQLLAPHNSCDLSNYDRDFIKQKDVNPLGADMEFGMAKFGLWSCWLIWVLLIIMASIQIYQYHNQEDFFISLHRERERLVQRIHPNGQTSYSV